MFAAALNTILRHYYFVHLPLGHTVRDTAQGICVSCSCTLANVMCLSVCLLLILCQVFAPVNQESRVSDTSMRHKYFRYMASGIHSS